MTSLVSIFILFVTSTSKSYNHRLFRNTQWKSNRDSKTSSKLLKLVWTEITVKTSNTLQKSLQTASTSTCRMYMLLTSSVLSATSKQCFELTSSVLSATSKLYFELTSSVLSATSKLYFEQLSASFLVCFLIFIEYKINLIALTSKKCTIVDWSQTSTIQLLKHWEKP